MFRPLLDKSVVIYLDDILIYSRILGGPQAAHCRGPWTACVPMNCMPRCPSANSARSKVEFLGHVVSNDGVAVDNKKIEAIQSWPSPQNIHDLRAFLGLANYYRRFVENYSKLTRCL